MAQSQPRISSRSGLASNNTQLPSSQLYWHAKMITSRYIDASDEISAFHDFSLAFPRPFASISSGLRGISRTRSLIGSAVYITKRSNHGLNLAETSCEKQFWTSPKVAMGAGEKCRVCQQLHVSILPFSLPCPPWTLCIIILAMHFHLVSFSFVE